MSTNNPTLDSTTPQVLSKPVDLFKLLAATKPIYTKRWIKAQIEMIDEHTSINDLIELLHHANLLIRANDSKKKIIKVRTLTARITMHLTMKAMQL